MVSSIGVSLSGLAAASTRLNTAAQNIANASSTKSSVNGTVADKPYVPQQVVQTSLQSGGVTAGTQPVNPPAVTVASDNGPAQTPNVDFAQQLVQAKVASYDFQGNLTAIKVQNENFKSLLNIVS